MPKQVHETAAITEAAAATAKKTGRMLMQFISPGWGSSGYYASDVLEQAVTDQVIPAGTHMYADHPTEAEDIERPVRSIKDLMAVSTGPSRLATEADVNAWGAELGAVVGEVQVVPQWRDLVETVKDSIGVSIRGSATDIVEGEAEGRRGGIIEGLVAPVMSVDFVTRAGRGGKVLSVLESAAANRRALDHGIAEATVNDTREALQTVLRHTYGAGERTYVWVRDFDDTTVWFEVENADNSGLFAQTYEQADTTVSLTGDRTEVRVRTTYVTVTRPDSNTPTTEADLEVTMGNIQIEESEHKRLTETAGRVDALVAENATLKTENATLKEADAARVRADRARVIVGARAQEAGVTFTDREVKGFLADVVVKEDGNLDEDAFTKLVDEDAAAKKKAVGEGAVSGFGGPVGVVTDTDGELTPQLVESQIGSAFGRSVKEA